MGTATNVVVGVGELYLAAYGATAPTIPADADSAITMPAGWTNLGYTQDGVKVEYSPKVTQIFVDQTPSAVHSILTGEDLKVTTNLAELTIENLAKVISASTYTSTSATKKSIGIGGGALLDYALCFIGPGPDGGKSVLLVHKCRSIGAAGPKFSKEAAAQLPVEITALVDDTKTTGHQLCDWYELRPAA